MYQMSTIYYMTKEEFHYEICHPKPCCFLIHLHNEFPSSKVKLKQEVTNVIGNHKQL